MEQLWKRKLRTYRPYGINTQEWGSARKWREHNVDVVNNWRHICFNCIVTLWNKYGRWRRPLGRKLRQKYNYRFCLYIYIYTVKPRLSGLQLSGNTAIRTVFLGNEKTQRKIAPFIRKSVFPEPDSSLGNQTMFYNDQRSVLSGHAPECHWLQWLVAV